MSQPEDFSEDLFVQRVAGAAETVRRMRAYLFTRGVETREFLDACELIRQAATGHPHGEGAVKRAAQTFGMFMAQLNALPDFPPQWTEAERLQWEQQSELLNFDEMLGQAAENFQGTTAAGLAVTAEKLRAEFQAAVQAGKNPAEIMRDFQLMVTAENAEVTQRVKFRNAVLVMHWDELPPEGKDQLLGIIKQWREGEREKTLSALPIEDRRRLEAMEQWRREDWGKSGLIEP